MASKQARQCKPLSVRALLLTEGRWGAVSWTRAPAMGGCRRGRFRQSLGGRVWCWCCRDEGAARVTGGVMGGAERAKSRTARRRKKLQAQDWRQGYS